MKAPQIPVNEAERMNALRESGLLEIDNYPAFDRLTRLATRFFRVPLAMITLVDDHAVIVKSADGRVPVSQPRELSFCGHTILGTRRWWWGYAAGRTLCGQPAGGGRAWRALLCRLPAAFT